MRDRRGCEVSCEVVNLARLRYDRRPGERSGMSLEPQTLSTAVMTPDTVPERQGR